MKKLIFSFSALTFLITAAFTGGETCNGNDFFHEGVKSKMGYYSADGTSTGSGTSDVTKVYTSGDSTIAVLNSVYTDLKQQTHASIMRLICVKDLFVIDMAGMMNSMMPGRNFKMVCSGNMVGYKQSYTVGEKLDSINMQMDMYSNDALMLTTNVRVFDRKVEAYQDVTVPAGTFKCYKISYYSAGTSTMKGKVMPAGKPQKSIMYYFPKLGMIRMEQFDATDKLFSYSELLELKTP